MIQFKVAHLRRRKAYEENRKVTLQEIANETGLSVGAVHRITTGNLERVDVSTLNALCHYFNVKSINELMEYVPDETEGAASA